MSAIAVLEPSTQELLAIDPPQPQMRELEIQMILGGQAAVNDI